MTGETNRISVEVIPNIESLTVNKFIDERTELGTRVYTELLAKLRH